MPFSVTIPPDGRDPELAEKLKAEWPGILQWMIGGCIDWLERDGLDPPQAVLDATAEYFEGEDAMAAWLDECCEIDKSKADSSSVLYQSWRDWTDRAREWCGSQREFTQKMVARGFEKKRTNTGAQFVGLAVKHTVHWSESDACDG